MLQSLALLLLIAAPVDPKLKAEEQARVNSEAVIKGDYETVIDLTYPKVIAAGGGREVMLKKMREVLGRMQDEGFSFDSCEVQTPSEPIRTGDGLFCVVPVTIRMKLKDRKITAKSSLIGVSSDDGGSWKFIDVAPGEKKIRQLLPEIPKELEIPRPVKPEIAPDAP